jgi:hypothetical protein
MPDHFDNRASIIAALRRELVGPDHAGPEIDVEADIAFGDYLEANSPRRQRGSGEEILIQDYPTKRYGIGVLFPLRVRVEEVPAGEGGVGEPEGESVGQEDMASAVGPGPEDSSEPPEIDSLGRPEVIPGAEDDFDLSLANAYQPSSVGLSFLAELPPDSKLVVEAGGGRYRRKAITIKRGEEERTRNWWLRSPVRVQAEFRSQDLLRAGSARLRVRRGDEAFIGTNTEGFDLVVEVLSRPQEGRRSLLTVCIVNRTVPSGQRGTDESSLFQTSLRATVSSPAGDAHVLPYPDVRAAGDPEEASLALLYRHAQTFATGHGCAADWQAAEATQRASSVWVECLPLAETPDIMPDVKREDGTMVLIPMASLAGLVEEDDGRAQLTEVIELYERWIEEQRGRLAGLPAPYQPAATSHLEECARAASRMREGLTYLDQSEDARRAFRFANHAILLQQIAAARATPRRPRAAPPVGTGLVFDHAYRAPDIAAVPPDRGKWRPFQIAFLLATIKSAGESDARDRRTVELIWFPTGGGKTEAYLGLAAFAMFKRRLENAGDAGVHVLMRYTLRLLTAQQFLRASALICAMEHLRRRYAEELGSKQFSIGIWLGGETTPNTREQARRVLSEFLKSRDEGYPFLLTRCPWCSAGFERVRIGGRGRGTILAPAYARRGDTVALACPDPACEFSSGLPLYVVDEDIYEERPTLVIGTIDKFAALAWRPDARALFGLDPEGGRLSSPPGLIIQDELHLISGPLGSLAGLYETIIEELCTDRRGRAPIQPKIVSSTATIRRYADQIRCLYGREDIALFPPPGLDAGNSFFARYDRDRPGRVYVGVHGPSLGSGQTQSVRTFAALLQVPMSLDPGDRDPWWTMLVFFNSIREMGTAHTLFHSDVPDYLRVIWNREGIGPDARRRLGASRVFELTGGLQPGEVADAIAKLETPYGDARTPAIDICMASSFIEVGIDIRRLSFMVVAGQPKTTSQYIQVTGRVGRRADRPGLIVTMYSPTKPRDRSHFERFRSYHERLYAYVEPTSVTPFSPPALDRALHAVMAGYARQAHRRSVAERPYPYPADIVEKFKLLLLSRVGAVDPGERENVERVLERRAKEWRSWERTRWARDGGEDIPLLRAAGEYATAEERDISWPTPTSMRNVDAECVAEITTLYIRSAGNTDA